jgi:hypothetical protein
MLRRWSNATIALGTALFIGGAVFLYLRIETELKFADLTSGNPNWHRPAATNLDRFILSFPADSVLVAGLILLIAGYVARRRNGPAGPK